jgi:integrase
MTRGMTRNRQVVGKPAKVIPLPAPDKAPVEAKRKRKSVEPVQAAVDALPYGSGTWRIEGSMGLYVRCRAKSKSYLVQRKVAGRLVQCVLGELSLAAARREAQRIWRDLKPMAPEGKITLGEAWARYLEERPLAPKTRVIYSENIARYLSDWRGRTLEAIGQDRAGFRARILKISREHGLAVASQTLRCFRAVYNYHRKIAPDLPECPAVAVDLPGIKPRDWALSDDELRQWWAGVQRLKPLKQTLWLTLLLTGARRDSVRMLRWADVDFDRRVIRFSTAKAGRTYAVPMPDRLAAILAAWREQAPPSEWVFPSPQRANAPLSEQVRDDKRGVASAHHLRHSYRTVLAQIGCPPDSARLLMGHSLSGDVSRGYITPGLMTESLRPWAEAVQKRYSEVMGWP